MIKYNYKGASDLFKKYYNYFCDPWDFDDNMYQKERRIFMHAFTRGRGTNDYIDYARERLENYVDGDIIEGVQIIEKMLHFNGKI